ncbi:MAG TPA: hypothetical protein VM600_02130 [Actinomycetota bacterium]|nr:hypothetical protein [Actinomycetota bacterium]
MARPRVILYSKDGGCELCDEAASMLDAMEEQYEVRTEAVFAERVPVITVDGRVVTEGRVSERAVRRALKHPRPTP